MPQAPTPNRGLVAPALTDTADGPDALDDLRQQLDNIAGIGWSTLAARPIAVGTVGTALGCPGTFHWSTDTNQLALSVGGQWIDLSGASAPPIPIGAALEYAGNGDPSDSRFLLEDGRELLRAGTYAPLYSITGNTYGAGNGSTTFNLPDSRGRVTVGPDNMGTSRGAAGRLPSHPGGRGNVGGADQHQHYCAGVDHLHWTAAPDHLHGPGSLYAADHAHTTNVRNPAYAGDVGPFASGAGATILANRDHRHDTFGSGNLGIGGATGAADRGLGNWSGASDRSLAFYSNLTAIMPPYVVKNKIIRVR
jgi:hypothetical protein